MRTIQAERFPEAVTLLEERFPGAHELCPKCEKPLDSLVYHVPAELGGGCIDHNDRSCEFCHELDEHAPWCELARQGR